MELLDIVDENGQPTGKTVERELAHAQGIRHRTSHVWLLRRRGGEVEVLLQKRSAQKDSHPGCYDISSAGHIPAGVDFRESAVRELREELGLEASPEELLFCGNRSFYWKDSFHGKPFLDQQYSRVFGLWKDVEVSALHLQKEEVSEAVWITWQKCRDGVEKGTFPNCIHIEELDMLYSLF